jgi:hypothetical protein
MVSDVEKSGDLSTLAGNALSALYLHSFFQWMYSLGSEIARGQQTSIDVLSDLRQLLRYTEKVGDVDESALFDLISARNDPDDSSQLILWTRALMCAQERLFGSKAENLKPIVNVYAKTSQNEGSGSGDAKEHSLEPWKPSSSVARSAKEYMAAILYMSS